MDLIASFATSSLSGKDRAVDLYVGDVTHTDGPVDLLCLSAFPNDYTPLPHGVIGALHRRGLDVAALAREKAHDWRAVWQCWVSQPLPHDVRRLLCFEHAWSSAPDSAPDSAPRASAPELVGNVFRAIRELVLAESPAGAASGQDVIERVRIPLLASGDQRAHRGDMLDATITQAYLSLVGELPVQRVEIVLHPSARDLHALLVRAGMAWEQVRAEWAQQQVATSHDFDYFISYRRRDADRVNPVLERMRQLEPGVRLFIDREQLTAGGYWKSDLMRGLARSARALCFITDSYPESAECMDEFHAALCMARERTGTAFLRPMLWLATRPVDGLPRSMRRVQCLDAGTAGPPPDAVASLALRGH